MSKINIKSSILHRPQNSSVLFLLLVSSLIILIRSSWVGDDAYITLRTVDNYLHGLGLTWNPGERVQTFTHPLWFWMLVLVYAIFPKLSFAYFAILSLSLFCSIAVIWIALRKYSGKALTMFLLWLMLVSSRAFIDYSTSGLENPASHLLAVLFLVIFLERNALGDNKIHLAYFIAGLATFNRMDNILLFLPATIYLMTQYPNKSWRFLLLGFLPFILWEIFSLFYFGFLFPNTAYAKLNTGISLSLYLKQGVLYFINSLRWDPVTLLVIGASLLLVSMRGKKEEKLIALGMGLYLLYVLYIGGDFMSGRFFSTVYLLGTILLTSLFSNSRTLEQVVILLLILAFGYAGTSPVFWDWRIDNKQMRALPGGDVAGIGDQRELWYEDSTLMNMDRVSVFPSHIATEEGLRRRSQGGVFVEVQIGYLGFFAGPKTYIIDEYSLTDPLLARLPIDDKSSWRIGHFSRLLPDGYLSSIESGTNMISDPNLAEYYDKLKLIISGEILNRERLETIWRMNTGQYDYLIANYLNDK